MKRIFLVLAVAALMAMMLLASAMPAFAAKPAFTEDPGEKNNAGPEFGQNIGFDCNRVQHGGCRAIPDKPPQVP